MGSKVSAGETTAAQMQALMDYLGPLSQEVTRITPAVEQGRVDVSRQISPQIIDIQADILDDGGRRLSAIGSDIAAENRARQVESELDILRGPGGELVRAASDVARLSDPEFFALREQAARKAENLLGAAAVEPTGSELAFIERGINRGNIGRGLAGSGSRTGAISNALQFGDERMKRLGAVSSAINSATSLLPATRQNVDVFAQGTGRVGTTNFGQQQFTGVQQQSGDTMGMANNLLSEAGQNARNANQVNSQNDFFDRFQQTLGGLGSFFGG